tara:strand:+ start:409 stop:516 length:108 start_codon:yes stop_codon:yes gene_type:complete
MGQHKLKAVAAQYSPLASAVAAILQAVTQALKAPD